MGGSAGKRVQDNKDMIIMLENTHEFIQVCLQAAGEFGCRIVLVGGAVRDYLAGRAISDYDFVADTADKELVRALSLRIAELSGGAFVVLDADRGFFRIARKDAHADIATRIGDSLTVDAYSRDFTVNAVYKDFAYDNYFDPCGGIADLRGNVLRTVSPEALNRDPLRVLRAWRMVCKYNMRYDEELETQVREAAAKLGKVASERITEEIFYCLGCDIVPHWDFAVKNGILEALFPECKGAFYSARLALIELDKAIDALPQTLRCQVAERLDKVMAAQRTVRQNLRLAVILGAGLEGVDASGAEYGKLSGEPRAAGSKDAESAHSCLQRTVWLERVCARFSLSRRERKFLAKVVPYCAEPARLYADKLPLRRWNALFRRNMYVPELTLCAYALSAALTPATKRAPVPAPEPVPATSTVPLSTLCDEPTPAPMPALCDSPAPAHPVSPPFPLRVKHLFENGDFYDYVIFMIGDFFQEGQVCQPNIPYTGADIAEKYSLSGEAIRKILDELAGISAERGGLSAKDAEEYISEIMNR